MLIIMINDDYLDPYKKKIPAIMRMQQVYMYRGYTFYLWKKAKNQFYRNKEKSWFKKEETITCELGITKSNFKDEEKTET